MPLFGGVFGATVGICITVLKNSLALQRKLAGNPNLKTLNKYLIATFYYIFNGFHRAVDTCLHGWHWWLYRL
jgi:hypothetical protein